MYRDQANVVGQFRPNNNAPYGNTYNSSWRNHPNFSWKARATQYQQPDPPSQQSSSIEQIIANLSKVVGDFVGKQEATNARVDQRMDRVDQRMDRMETLQGKKGVRNAAEILEVLRQVKVNIPLLDMIKQVPTYAKFLKDLCTIKRGLTVNKKAFLTEQVSAILQCKSPLKYKDPGSPTISVMIGGKVVEKALLDLGASVNLLPYSVYKQLGLGELKPTAITLSLADRSVKIPRGVIEDVLVQVDNFYYPVDFVVLDTDPTVKEANLVPIILGRPFLATSNAIINCRNGLMQLTFGFSESPIGLATLQSWRKIEGILPLFNEEEEAAVEKEIPKLNLKPLPVELKYTYLEENNQCPVVISSSQTKSQVKDASFKWDPGKLNQEGQKHCRSLCECISQRKWFGTRVPLRRTVASISAAKPIAKWKSMISHQKSHSAGHFAIAKVVWHTSATSQHSDINFAAAKLTAKLLRKWQVAAKLAFCCENNLTPGLPFFLFIPVKSAAKRVSKIRAPFSQPLHLLQATPSVSPVVFSV
ncbi:hypothetical protein CK203_101295 [Vitis vinifera]|uniref:Uncharacterized protein n=1 Tax=Vitis vinifera TaxID=29760 RepID=A0A438DH99_VITVI|nr:hypothetical protein CK203_101295 [Vitis vinifera]